jgi:hypothetical protein
MTEPINRQENATMKTTRRQTLIGAVLAFAGASTAVHAQSAKSPYKFERGFPTSGTAKSAYDASDLRRAIEAYKFFYPTIGTEAVMQQMLAAGYFAMRSGSIADLKVATTSVRTPKTASVFGRPRLHERSKGQPCAAFRIPSSKCQRG